MMTDWYPSGEPETEEGSRQDVPGGGRAGGLRAQAHGDGRKGGQHR